MSRLSAAENSLIIQRELLRLRILENKESSPGAICECERSGNPWLRSLGLALTTTKNTAVEQGSQLEHIIRRLK